MSEGPRRRRVLSLTWRLVGGYTLAALGTLSLASYLLHRELRQKFEIENTHILADFINTVRAETLSHKGDLHEAEELITKSAGERQVAKYYGRLIHAEGRVLVETLQAGKMMPPREAFPPPLGIGEPVVKLIPATARSGDPVWIATALVERGGGHRPVEFQLALHIRHLEQWLDEYRNTLILMTAGATAATALLGWFITRRSLRPLREITSTAQRITAQGLSEQIGNQPWPQELSSLAAEFDRMLQRLRESFDRLSQFTADAAHEFRTPLNNLLGGTSLALARPRTPEDYRNLLETNLDEYHRLHHMMESLLFLARADNQRTVIRRESIAAAGALQEVEEFFSALAEDRGISIQRHGEGTVYAEPTLLRMALTNLVSNALRHSSKGGKIVLSATARDQGLEIAVEDHGEGIPAEHLPRVFDRFYRVEQSRANPTGNTGGSGLGLALVKTIMDLHDGTAEVESAVGHGTTFRLWFPPAD